MLRKDPCYLLFTAATALLLCLGVILTNLPTGADANAGSPPSRMPEDVASSPVVANHLFLPAVIHSSAATWLPLGPAAVDVDVMAGQSHFLYAGTSGSGAFRTVDGGQSWEQMSNGLPTDYNVRRIAVAEHVPTLYAAEPHGLYRSDDNGQAWVSIVSPRFWYSALTMNPVTPTIVYVGSGMFETAGGEVYRSRDGGLSWQQILPRYTLADDIAIDPADTRIVYLGRSSPGGMLKSTDDGDIWTPINNGLSGRALSIFEILIVPADSRQLYIRTGDGLYYSSDGGDNWLKTGQNLPGWFVSAVALLPDGSGDLAVSTASGDGCYGVSRLAAGGGGWQDISGNLGSRTCVRQLLAAGTPHPALYALAEIEFNAGQIWRLESP